MPNQKLADAHILIIEDEYFLADEARSGLVEAGAVVIGPVPTAEEATALIEAGGQIDCALLDINLRGDMVYRVADLLQARATPFAFVTGYDRAALPERFSATPTLGKPVHPDQLVRLVEQVMALPGVADDD